MSNPQERPHSAWAPPPPFQAPYLGLGQDGDTPQATCSQGAPLDSEPRPPIPRPVLSRRMPPPPVPWVCRQPVVSWEGASAKARGGAPGHRAATAAGLPSHSPTFSEAAQ